MRKKLRRRIPRDDADTFVALLSRAAVTCLDPAGPPPLRSADPADDYVISLAASCDAVLVSGDRHLTALADRAPVLTATEFAERLESERRASA